MQTLSGWENLMDRPAVVEPSPARKPGKRRPRLRRGLVAALAAVALFAVGMAAAPRDAEQPVDPQVAGAPIAVAGPATPSALADPVRLAPVPGVVPGSPLSDASDVGAAVIPSVVTVQIGGTVGNQQAVIGSGSGVIYDTAGRIVTNAHVVDGGDSFTVVLSDGRIYPAELIGVDAGTDLAVLEIAAADITPIALGSTDVLRVGDPAIAVGSPLGLEGGPSLSVGVISAFGRVVRTDATTALYGMLQADAPITQGSSGGALVDASGRLIGITSAVGVSEVGVEGIGFSTPIEIVTRVVNEIIATGEASGPYLGITGITAVTGLADGGERPIGVRVESVEPGSAAAAGIQSGAVVTAINGRSIRTMQELIAQLRRFSSGDRVDIALGDGGAVDFVAVQLGDR